MTLRAALTLGTHQWVVIAPDGDGERYQPIGDQRLFGSKAELAAALQERGFVLTSTNRVLPAVKEEM